MNNNISKQDIEKCVRVVLQKKHIPGENKIRQIVKEEIEKYHEKEELEQKKSFSKTVNDYFHEKKYLNIGWYILMFALLLFDVLGFKVLTEFGQQIIQNLKMINFYIILFVVVTLFITSFAILLSMKVYDKMIEKDYKHAKIICLLEILYWCNILFPDISSWIEKFL